MAYVQQALSKTKPATNINDVEEKENQSNRLQITTSRRVC